MPLVSIILILLGLRFATYFLNRGESESQLPDSDTREYQKKLRNEDEGSCFKVYGRINTQNVQIFNLE